MTDLNATLAERGARYGDFTDHARIAQQLQDVMHRSGAVGLDMAANKGWHALSPVQKQALTVIADKIARILSGDPNYTDNWHDIQGYAKLAEERCADTTLPQLAFPPVSDGKTFDVFDAHHLLDTFRDAVVHGTGAALNGKHVPIADVASEHLLDRQGDEFFCPRCAKRWGTDEPAPACKPKGARR